MTEITPARGDAVEAWIKTKRDEHQKHTNIWYALDSLLNDYQLHADCGTPLSEETPDGIPGSVDGVGERQPRRRTDEEVYESFLASEQWKDTPPERLARELAEQDEPLIDPDCRDGKCSSCVGGPCQHTCHQAGSEAGR